MQEILREVDCTPNYNDAYKIIQVTLTLKWGLKIELRWPPKAITNLSDLEKIFTIGHLTLITLKSCYLPGTVVNTHLIVPTVL